MDTIEKSTAASWAKATVQEAIAEYLNKNEDVRSTLRGARLAAYAVVAWAAFGVYRHLSEANTDEAGGRDGR